LHILTLSAKALNWFFKRLVIIMFPLEEIPIRPKTGLKKALPCIGIAWGIVNAPCPPTPNAMLPPPVLNKLFNDGAKAKLVLSSSPSKSPIAGTL